MKDERELPGGPAAETLLEMGNIGTGSSMASLSHIIGEKVCYAPPVMKTVDYDGLAEWIGYMVDTPAMTDEIAAYIAKEQQELSGAFCRGCGYCMPCPAGIMINQCARMSLMLRRAPSKAWLTPSMQAEMKKIENCLNCRQCTKKCPYELDTPELLKKNYEDYKKVLAGEIEV